MAKTPSSVRDGVKVPGYRTKLHYHAPKDHITNGGQVIADKVIASQAEVDGRGLRLSVTVEEQRGGKSNTSTYVTYVVFRNRR